MQTKKTTVLIVDNDSESSKNLEFLLGTISDIEIIGTFSEASLASMSFYEQVPDIIFLEVELPEKNGFEFLNEIRQNNNFSCVIIQTVKDQYAIQAIRNSVFDYLLKPITRDDLVNTLIRYKTHMHRAILDTKLDRLLRHLQEHEKIRFNTRHGFILLDPSEIAYCNADWSYTEIYRFGGNMTVVSLNIGKVEELLDPSRFLRISRSTLVNISTIVSIDRKNHTCVISCDGHETEFHITGMHLRNFDKWKK